MIRELAEKKPIVLIEHDIAILDMLADTVHVAYGKPAVFGIITRPKGVRVGINQYLDGFLAEENVRIRDYPVTFEVRTHDEGAKKNQLMQIPVMSKKFDRFSLNVNGGDIRAGEVIVV